MKMILASKSPRREKILSNIFSEITIYNSDIEEVCIESNPKKTAQTNALLKVEVAISRFPNEYILAADTVISFENRIIGKPKNFEHAYNIFKDLSGKKHEVITAVAFYEPFKKKKDIDMCRTNVYFKSLSDNDIRKYQKLVSPLDKAGGYNIDEHADLIIEKIDGSKTNVMGLPIEVVRKIKDDNFRKLQKS